MRRRALDLDAACALVYTETDNNDGTTTLVATQGEGGPVIFTVVAEPLSNLFTFTLEGPVDNDPGR